MELCWKGFWDAHPDFARRFPGGIVQFVQFAAQMDEGALEGMMVEVAAAAGAGGGAEGGMPGMMPGLDVFGDEGDFVNEGEGDDDDEDEEGEEGAVSADLSMNLWDEHLTCKQMPVRLLRTFVNRFWGGAQVEGDGSSDEEGENDEQDEAQPH
jgi:hypothetical protein